MARGELAATMQTLLTVAAIGAAIAAPYIAAGLDKRRRHRAVLRLAELLCEALAALAAYHGTESDRTDEEIIRTSETLNLQTLIKRADDFPTDAIDNPAVLEAFIRIGGTSKAMLLVSDQSRAVVNGVRNTLVEHTIKRLAERAHHELAVMRRHTS